MFIGRKRELEILEKFYAKDSFNLVTLHGRRRVGKTELLNHFSQGKKTLFFSAEETTRVINLEKLSKKFSDLQKGQTGTFLDWEDFFAALKAYSDDAKLLFIIDEFPYLAEQDKTFLSSFQHIIDHKLKDSNLMIILCGSSIAFMENLLGEKSPIFGRITGQLHLKAFKYYEAVQMLPDLKGQDRLEAFFILGGIPDYLRKFKSSTDLKKMIIDNIFDNSEELYNIPSNLLKQELRNPAVYNAILESISNGASKPNEIMTKIGVTPAVGQKYLDVLIGLQLIEKIKPINQANKRKSYYQLSDNLFEFVYKFAYKYRSHIEEGNGKIIYHQMVEPNLSTHYGKKFEKVCFEYIQRQNANMALPQFFIDLGKWWGGNKQTKSEEEIDIVCFTENSGLYGECKYRNEPVGMKTLESLRRKSYLIPKEKMYYYLFSKAGFTKDLIDYVRGNENIMLVDMNEILSIKKPSSN